MPTPFDFIKDLSKEKTNLLEKDYGTNNPDYNQFMINKGFSYFSDTILHADQMNSLPQLENLMHNKYYLEALPSRNRFSKWHKPSKDEDITVIQQVYKCGKRRAMEYLLILSKEQMSDLRKKCETGGVTK